MKDVRELFAALSAAMSAQKETALTWTRGDAVVTACVKPAPPVWGAPMIVQVRVERPGVLWWQCFASVEEMRGRWGERVFKAVAQSKGIKKTAAKHDSYVATLRPASGSNQEIRAR